MTKNSTHHFFGNKYLFLVNLVNKNKQKQNKTNLKSHLFLKEEKNILLLFCIKK
jgi:hypothetical protein